MDSRMMQPPLSWMLLQLGTSCLSLKMSTVVPCALEFLVSLPRTFARDACDREALFSFPAHGNNEG